MKILIATIIAVLLIILTFEFFSVTLNKNEDLGYNKRATRFNIYKWGIRALFLIVIAITAAIYITRDNNHNEFNSQAQICGLGFYDNHERISTVLDSLCQQNCVKFGELITDEDDLKTIFHDYGKPNSYIVGCQDTLTGDRLEIQFTIQRGDTYDGNSWLTYYNNEMEQISLRNEKGINLAHVKIDPAYLPGGEGFEKGYCATISDTCAVLYRDRQ